MQTEIKNAKKDSNLSKINFDKFAKDVQNVTAKSSSTQRSQLYIYPEKWNALQINGSEGKNFRGDKRRKLLSFANLIQLHYKMKSAEKLIEEIKNFKKFYKEFFKINDFSINSITNVKGELNAEYQKMLNIVKEVNASFEKTTSKKEKKEVVKPEIKKEISEVK